MNERASILQIFCESVPHKVLSGIAREIYAATDISHVFDSLRKINIRENIIFQLREVAPLYRTPQELSVAIETASKFIEDKKQIRPHFVWSGPTDSLQVRHTRQVLLDLINASREKLVLVSFAAYKVDVLLSAIKKACERSVKVSFILETEEDSDGFLSVSASHAFEGIAGAKFYHWPKEKRNVHSESYAGVMHIKCAVSENEYFITSANLTEKGMNDNWELGILSKDKSNAAILMENFSELIKKGYLVSQAI